MSSSPPFSSFTMMSSNPSPWDSTILLAISTLIGIACLPRAYTRLAEFSLLLAGPEVHRQGVNIGDHKILIEKDGRGTHVE
jgi:hypothetical protein